MQLPADATLSHAATLAAELPAAVAQGSGAFTVDASALQQYDSATIALLLQARRLAQGAGRSFHVTGLPHKLQQLAVLYGVDGLLSLSPSGPAAAE